MSLNTTTFLSEITALFPHSPNARQEAGMVAILTEWEKRKPQGDLRWLAYMLATAYHETAQTMQPVREAFWKTEAWRKANLSYYPYYGRGYVQLTHQGNYAKAGHAVGQDLVGQPDRALDPDIAAHVMFVGMEEGWFRASKDGMRHSLPRYFSDSVDDAVGARKIINGPEYKTVNGVKVLLATIIAEYHATFLAALKAAQGASAQADASSGAMVSDALVDGTVTTLAAAPAEVASSNMGYARSAAGIATAEWEFFGRQTYDLDGSVDHVGHKEGENGWWQRVGAYWEEGTNTHGLDGRDHDWPWSATFVSWVARKAGAGKRFRYSTQHSVYISQGIREYLNKTETFGFWTVRLHEARPEVGDIVCWGREAGVDYDHQKNGDYKGHADHVVEVEADRIWIIGGNVGNSVTRRPLALTSEGFLKPIVSHGENLFGLMKNRLG